MKKRILAYSLFIIVAFGCTDNKKNSSSQDQNMAENTGKTEKVSTSTPTSGIIREERTVPSDGFYQVTLVGSPDVVFTQGPYSIVVEGHPDIISSVVTEIDSKSLQINIEGEHFIERQSFNNASGVTVYVSCPEIKYIAVCGSGKFKTEGTISGDDMQFGIMGSGGLDIEKIQCKNFDLQASGNGETDIDEIIAENANITSVGGGDTDCSLNVSGNVSIENGGNGETDIKCTSKKLEIYTNSTGDFDLDINCDNFKLTAAGTGKIEMKGMATTKQIHNSLNCKIEDYISKK